MWDGREPVWGSMSGWPSAQAMGAAIDAAKACEKGR